MQQRIRGHRTLDDSLIDGAVVAIAMYLERKLAIIMLQAFNFRLPVGSCGVHFRTGFVARARTAALPSVSRFAWAQAYPTRPVRLIVPLAPAGASDITARLIGQWLTKPRRSGVKRVTFAGLSLDIITVTVGRPPLLCVGADE